MLRLVVYTTDDRDSNNESLHWIMRSKQELDPLTLTQFVLVKGKVDGGVDKNPSQGRN